MYKNILKLFLLFLLGCSNEISEKNEPQSISNDQNDIKSLLQKYSLKSPVFYDTQDDYLVGGVRDVKQHEGLIYLIDSVDIKILVLNKQGELIRQVGRKGRGPGEYERPVTMDITNDGLILLDQNLRRITRYAFDDSNKLVLDTSGVPGINMTDMCKSNGNIWVHSYYRGNVIHLISNDLETIEHSYGHGYDAEVLVKEKVSSNGSIACHNSYIYSGFLYDNKISVYKDDGTFVHEIEFQEIVPLSISRENYQGIEGLAHRGYLGEAYNIKGDYHDILQNLIVINNHLLVQYERSYQDGNPDRQYIISLYVNLDDFTYTINNNISLIFDASSEIMLTGSNYPLPHVELRRAYN